MNDGADSNLNGRIAALREKAISYPTIGGH
jgi:hypothetical protein